MCLWVGDQRNMVRMQGLQRGMEGWKEDLENCKKMIGKI